MYINNISELNSTNRIVDFHGFFDGLLGEDLIKAQHVFLRLATRD